jgi:enoyl-CoA hydratase/carnithine racemase
MNGDQLVSTRREGRVAVITLSNPPVGALSTALVQQLDDLLRLLSESDPSRAPGAVVVTSAVPGFFGCGADLKLLANLEAGEFAAYLASVRAPLERLRALPLVSIAALDGLALGGGLELALACTFRVASTDTVRVGLPEIKLGLLPGAGGTQRLTRLIGRDAALDLMLSGRQISAEEACACGVVSRAVPGRAEEEALRWAAELAELPSTAVAAILRCVDAALELSTPDGMSYEADAIAELFATPEAQEAISEFVAVRARRSASGA